MIIDGYDVLRCAEIVERIVSERDAGSSFRTIADGLTRDGIATAQGGRSWHASTVRKVLTGQQANISNKLGES